VSGWGPVEAPRPVEGTAPGTGALEPALRWLASCRGEWPPRRPSCVRSVRLGEGGPPDAPSSSDTGRAVADDLVDRGADLLVLGGSGDTTGGLLVLAVLLDLEPVRAVGTAPGRDWVRQTVAVRDGLRVARTHRDDPAGLLAAVEAGAVAAGAGLLAQAASRRTPVLLDGSVLSAAAALAASLLAPGSPAWWLAGAAPPVPAAAEAYRSLGLRPLLDLGLDGPEGAQIALAVLEQGCDLAGRTARG
jgi:nicotinate-nucleotide--dimethylbenzimidazole phosphoribosyltransferase